MNEYNAHNNKKVWPKS